MAQRFFLARKHLERARLKDSEGTGNLLFQHPLYAPKPQRELTCPWFNPHSNSSGDVPNFGGERAASPLRVRMAGRLKIAGILWVVTSGFPVRAAVIARPCCTITSRKRRRTVGIQHG